MVGLSEATRDLDVVHAGLAQWFRHQRGPSSAIDVSPFGVNTSSGFSSESLLFELATTDVAGDVRIEPLVLRLAPSGGGLFPEYDLARQAATQNLLADLGVPAAAPAIHEADETWIGTDFLVMPRIAGRLPADFTYILKGWLKEEGESQSGRAASPSSTCSSSCTRWTPVRSTSGSSIARPDGGWRPRSAWWADYHDWASEGSPQPTMVDAYAWA